VLIGAFKANTWVAFLRRHRPDPGRGLCALALPQGRFGELTKDKLKNIVDMNRREIAVFLPLVLLSIWMGIYPASFLDPMAASGRQAGRRLPGRHQARPHGGIAVTRE
jgi:NADH-quinone oxidoreductase subunit M